MRLFARLEARSVRNAVKRYRREAAGAFVLLVVAIGGAFYTQGSDSASARKATVDSGRAVAVDGCNRDFRSTDTLRGIIIRLKVANEQTVKTALARTTDPTAKKALQEQRAAAQRFYDNTLDDLHYPRCGEARSIVTDDPSKTIVVPRPLTNADANNANVAAASKRIATGG